jgi:hypothetical protein
MSDEKLHIAREEHLVKKKAGKQSVERGRVFPSILAPDGVGLRD